MPEFPYEESLFYLNRFRFAGPSIEEAPAANLGMVVVIPCYNEPDLTGSLDSLWQCQPPAAAVEVIVVVNGSQHSPPEVRQQNQASLEAGRAWAAQHQRPGFRCHLLDFQELPPKHAGVGLARKTGMDEAVRRLEWAGNRRGWIVCFDADSRVLPNYFQALETHFQSHPKSPGCAIHYEHPLEGPLSAAHYQAILNYELHLRYYVHALRFAGHRHAHQTIGSSMAVRCDVYQKQGGMNRRKAGEDFYFLHKIIPLGHFSECTATMVIPSPRQSDRVPFGTGKAVGDHLQQGAPESYATYAFPIFADIKVFLDQLSSWYAHEEFSLEGLPGSVREFLIRENFTARWTEMKRQSKSRKTFEDRFFRWFDGFRAMKMVHFARDHFYPNQEIESAVWELEKAWPRLEIQAGASKKEMLLAQRLLDRAAR